MVKILLKIIVKEKKSRNDYYKSQSSKISKDYHKEVASSRSYFQSSYKTYNARLHSLRKLIHKKSIQLRNTNIRLHKNNYKFLKGAETRFRNMEKSRVKSYYAKLKKLNKKNHQLHLRAVNYRKVSHKKYHNERRRLAKWYRTKVHQLNVSNRKAYQKHLNYWKGVQATYKKRVAAAQASYRNKLAALGKLNHRRYLLNRKYYGNRQKLLQGQIKRLKQQTNRMHQHLRNLNQKAGSYYRSYVHHKNLELRYRDWARRQRSLWLSLKSQAKKQWRQYKRYQRLHAAHDRSMKAHIKRLRIHNQSKQAYQRFKHLVGLSKTHKKLASQYKSAHQTSLRALRNKEAEKNRKVTVIKRVPQ